MFLLITMNVSVVETVFLVKSRVSVTEESFFYEQWTKFRLLDGVPINEQCVVQLTHSNLVIQDTGRVSHRRVVFSIHQQSLSKQTVFEWMSKCLHHEDNITKECFSQRIFFETFDSQRFVHSLWPYLAGWATFPVRAASIWSWMALALVSR